MTQRQAQQADTYEADAKTCEYLAKRAKTKAQAQEYMAEARRLRKLAGRIADAARVAA